MARSLLLASNAPDTPMTTRAPRRKHAPVHALRHHLKLHRGLTSWLVGVALLIKILVPAGFMPVFSAQSVTLQLCSGVGPEQGAMGDMPGMGDHGHAMSAPSHDPASGDHNNGKNTHGAKEMPCGFGGLAMPHLSAADPVLLAIAFLFILAAGLSTRTVSIAPSIPHLRPPLRGPPLKA